MRPWIGCAAVIVRDPLSWVRLELYQPASNFNGRGRAEAVSREPRTRRRGADEARGAPQQELAQARRACRPGPGRGADRSCAMRSWRRWTCRRALEEAIRAARRINSRGGGARQRQYIGKLMRDVDPEPIRAALAARSAGGCPGDRALQARRGLARAADRRGRAGPGGAAALAAADRAAAEWARRVSSAQARACAHRGLPATLPRRELFRALRALFATMP